MGTTTIRPGMAGADYVYLTPAIKTWLLEHDVRFVARYVVPPYTTQINKDLKPEEIDWLAAHRIAIVPNWEIHHQDGLGGAVAGARAGTWLKAWAQQNRVPIDTHLICSIDTDTWAANLAVHTAYVNAFRDVVKPYRFGVYGDVDIARAVHGELFWRANASGWGVDPDVPVHIQQHRAQYPPGVDPNTCLTTFRAWLPGDNTDPTWHPEEIMGLHLKRGKPCIVDTRHGKGAPRRPLESGEVLYVGIPAAPNGDAAQGAVVTITAICPPGQKGGGHVQVDAGVFLEGSDLNPSSGDHEANTTLSAVDDEGRIAIRWTADRGAVCHIKVDLAGVLSGNGITID